MGKLKSIPGKSHRILLGFTTMIILKNKIKQRRCAHTHTHIYTMHTYTHTYTYAHNNTCTQMWAHTHSHLHAHTSLYFFILLFFFSILFCPEIVFLHVCPHTCYLTLPLECNLCEDRDLVSLTFYFQCPEQCLTHNTVP